MNVLDLPMPENDSGADTIRGYLKALLLLVWQEGECFESKRPFGNSGWDYDLYRVLVYNKYVKGVIDEDGDILKFDEAAAQKLISQAIKDL